MTLLLIMLGGFLLLAFLGVPVAVSLGMASVFGMLFSDVSLMVLPQRMFTGIDSFSYMAIPFFMLAGKLMEYGGISKRLVNFADIFLSKVRGGLAITSVIACAFFAALSGSSPGTVAAIGGILYPEMVKKGYDEEFSAGIVTVAGGLGPIIPPSILMVTFGIVTGTSISSLFMGGILIGLILMVAFCIVGYVISRKHNWTGSGEIRTTGEKLRITVSALPALGMPVIILGGIYGGMFTPTEAAVVAVVYSLLIGAFVYKELKIKDLIPAFVDSAIMSAVILLMISTSTPFSWIFAQQGLVAQIAAVITSVFSNAIAFTLFSFVLLLIFGTFMEGNAILLLLMPFLFPVSQSLGVNPIHFGVLSTVALCIGCCSPPVAVNIFTAVGVTGLPLGRVVKGMMPFFITMILVTLVYSMFPGISTFLPKLFG